MKLAVIQGKPARHTTTWEGLHTSVKTIARDRLKLAVVVSAAGEVGVFPNGS